MKINKYRTILTMFLVAIFSNTSTAFAQGRDITRADWVDRLPVFFIVCVIVLAVDFIFIRQIRRNAANSDESIWEKSDV